MEVEVRLFAILRERAGRDRLALSLPEGATVADALEAAGREPGLGEILAAMPVRVAVNREYVNSDATVAAGDELALIPPVSGGAGRRSGAKPTRAAVEVPCSAPAAVGPKMARTWEAERSEADPRRCRGALFRRRG